MDDKRQKNQLELAFMEEDRGEAPKDLQEGTESSAGKRGTESPAITVAPAPLTRMAALPWRVRVVV